VKLSSSSQSENQAINI